MLFRSDLTTRTKAHWDLWDTKLKVALAPITALSLLVGVGASIFGLVQHSDKTDARQSLADAQTFAERQKGTIETRDSTIEQQRATISDLNQQIGDLNGQVTTLEDDKSRLQEQLDAVSGTGAAGVDAGSPAVRHQGSANLGASNDSIDLDATSASWSSSFGGGDGADEIAYTQDNRLRIANGSRIALLGTKIGRAHV